MSSYYVDTCSLKWRYLTGNPTGDINLIVESDSNDVYIGELTILEWSSALAEAVRTHAITKDIFKTNVSALFSDIAQKRLKVFQARRVLERARSWIEYIGVIGLRHLRTNDAIHLSTALELSSQLRCQVTFVTSDSKLYGTLNSFDVLRPNLKTQYLQP